MPVSELLDADRDALVRNRVAYQDYLFIDFKMQPPLLMTTMETDEGYIVALNLIRKKMGIGPMTNVEQNNFRTQVARSRKTAEGAAKAA